MAYTNLSKKLAVALVVLLAIASIHTIAARELVDAAAMAARHERWMARHGRAYADHAEKARRLAVFRDNVAFIDSVNAAAANGRHKLWLEENRFADLTNAEFRAERTGLISPSRGGNGGAPTTPFRYANVNAGDLPVSLDWRSKGAVIPVKDQGNCGSCWAFSAVAAMEGAVKLTSGKLVSLSEQELVSCDVDGEDQGCSGGLMDDAFKFIINNGGLATESDYPYTANDDTCNITASYADFTAAEAATITGYEDVPANDETALLKAVANQPVSVAVAGGDRHFQFYKGGIISGAAGCGTELDHAITAVGYGVASDGTKYWLMKNSWGTSWGEDGYVRLERDVKDKQGVCGLAKMPSYPTA
uniref:Peptidase C1A papain C-terminal domain-containing protein n=1 Tax=Leersia perrieri TaxID=77586 RepID=A0A0D9W2N8_9ORYZ